MTEETQTKSVTVEAPAAAVDQAVPAPAKEEETVKEVTEVKEAEKPAAVEEPTAAPATDEADDNKKVGVGESPSFKEESYIASELPEFQKKALEELKKLVQEALNKHEFTAPPTPTAPCPAASTEEEEKKADAEDQTATSSEEPAAAAAKTEEIPVETAAEEKKKEAEKPAVEEKKEEAKPATSAAVVEEKKEVKESAAPAAVVEEKKIIDIVEDKKPADVVEEKKEEKKPVDAVEEKKEEKKDIPSTISKIFAKVTTATTKTVEAVTESVATATTTTPTTTEKTPTTTEKTEEEAPKEEETPAPEPALPVEPEEVELWGIPLLGDDRSDVILLKFLRARDFKVKESLAMLKKCVRWRKEFGVEALLDEDLGNDYEKVVFTHGCDKEGRPVVYNVFGEFNDKDLYQLAFSSAEKQKKFMRWLVQFVERTVRRFDFSPEGMNSFLIVNDLKNAPGYWKIFGKYMQLLQDNYPEFVSKQVCINVSFWYLAYSWVYVNVLSPRSKSKFVFATSSKTPDTLFRYISPAQVPVQYGGHGRAGELEFTPEEPVTEVTIKPSSSYPVEFTFTESCTLVWELRVVGWDVSYEAQFVPEEGYTVLVTKPKKMSPVSDDPILCDSFQVSQPGKLVITIDNHSSKKKKLLYRSKVKTAGETQTTPATPEITPAAAAAAAETTTIGATVTASS